MTGGKNETSEPFALTASVLVAGALFMGAGRGGIGAKAAPLGKMPGENGAIGIILSPVYGSTIHSISNMLIAAVLSNTTIPTLNRPGRSSVT